MNTQDLDRHITGNWGAEPLVDYDWIYYLHEVTETERQGTRNLRPSAQAAPAPH